MIELRPALSIAADQRGFGTERWQEREQQVDADLAAGRATVHHSTEDFLEHLDQLDAE